MKLLTKEQILTAVDLEKETVDVPEWNGSVMVRAMTGAERDKFEASLLTSSNQASYENIRARLVSLTIVDGDGERLFTDKDITDLGKKSASALDRVFGVAQRLNGMSPKDVDDLAKNSNADQNDASTLS